MPALSRADCLTARLAAALGGVLLLAAGIAAAAAAYPQHPVHIVVPNGPGGSIDQVVRAVSERMAATLGVPFVIDNREGASRAIGALLVKAAAPDGYVLLPSSTSTNTLTPAVQATHERRMIMFPQEWKRDPESAHFGTLPVDAPWNDPRVFAAMLGVR